MAKSRFIATILLPSPLGCAYLTTADASNLLLLFPLSFAEAITTADVFRFTPRRVRLSNSGLLLCIYKS
jgi:hypothetical protein